MRPILRASLLSCAAMAGGDALQQGIARARAKAGAGGSSRPESEKWSWARTARFASVGLCLHGPFFFAGFSALDRRFPGKALSAVVAKTATGQVTLFPAYLATALFALAALEGETLERAAARAGAAFPRAFAAGCAFWPAANLVNFALVPPGLGRVVYVNAAALVWNSYLSLVAADAAARMERAGVVGK